MQLFGKDLDPADRSTRISWLEDQAELQQRDCSELGPDSGGLIQITGLCFPVQTIGSEATPVILLVRDGSLYLGPGQTIFGVVIVYSSQPQSASPPQIVLQANARVAGALVAGPGVMITRDNRATLLDAPLVRQALAIRARYYRLAKVMASWRDWS
jgi:hypothetical protein